jgi:hypothetical protein
MMMRVCAQLFLGPRIVTEPPLAAHPFTATMAVNGLVDFGVGLILPVLLDDPFNLRL